MASYRQRRGFWFVRWVDETGVQRERKASRDLAGAKALGRKLEDEAHRLRTGLVSAAELTTRSQARRPIAEHLADWHADLVAKGRTEKHVTLYLERAGRLVAVIEGAPWSVVRPGRKPAKLTAGKAELAKVLGTALLSCLTPERIQAALGALRERNVALQTIEHYRAAMRAFCRWAANPTRNRLARSPMDGVAGYAADSDPRHPRRALTGEELAKLICAAESGRKVFTMPGKLRAIAYQIAAATGLRADEIRALNRESLHLNGPHPSVTLPGTVTKNGQPVDQPISAELGTALRAWLASAPPGKVLFPLHHETSKAIQKDLEAADIPYSTADGFADFHSLRGFYVSALIKSGASIAEVQRLARHSRPETTLKHYAKVQAHDLRAAVDRMPNLLPPPINNPVSLPQPYGEGIQSPPESAPVSIPIKDRGRRGKSAAG